MRLSTTSQSIQSVVSVASNIPNNQTTSFQQQAKRRCRDFDGMYNGMIFKKIESYQTLSLFLKT